MKNDDDNHTRAFVYTGKKDHKNTVSSDVCLVMIQGNEINKRFDLYKTPDRDKPCTVKKEFKIGRLEERNQIVINDDQISREHAVIIQDGMKFYINDLGSTNGTYVNDQKVLGVIRLHNQDRILLGNSLLKYLQGDIEAEFLSHLESKDGKK